MSVISPNDARQTRYGWAPTVLDKFQRVTRERVALPFGSRHDPYSDRLSQVHDSLLLLTLIHLEHSKGDSRAIADASKMIAQD